MAILKRDYFLENDVCALAKDLLGKELYTNFEGQVTGGIIYETEAYCGLSDKACHAYLNKRTKRTRLFYEKGGICYIYLCYGIHSLFNIITGREEHPKAILVRAISPLHGLEIMKARRGFPKNEKNLTNGPGKLSQALGLEVKYNGGHLTQENHIWLEDSKRQVSFSSTARIGIDYAGEDAKLPWRFVAHGFGAS